MSAPELQVLEGGAGESPIPLRPHQVEAVNSVVRDLKIYRSTLIVHPTGSGKTVTAGELIRRWVVSGARVLVICPAHLVDQFADHVRSVIGELGVSVEQGPRYAALTDRVVVASVPTLKGGRLSRFGAGHFDYVVADESHHSRSLSWQTVLERFAEAKVVGLTATPDRADNKPLVGPIFDTCSHEYMIPTAIRDGWLVPILYSRVLLEHLDLKGVKRTSGDYAQGELGRRMIDARGATDTVVEKTIELVGSRKAVVFAVTIEHAEILAGAFRDAGATAIAISSKTDKTLRAAGEAQFEAGVIQFLVNVGCYCEGWDHPPVSAIVLVRPTQSRSLYTQQIGRGLRLSPGKEDCLVLDFTASSSSHEIVHAPDVLRPRKDRKPGTNPFEDIGEGGVVDLLASMDEEIEKEAIAARVREIDVLERVSRAASAAQVGALAKFGIDAPEIEAREASALIDVLIERSRKQMATLKQIKSLVKAGTHPVDALAMTFAQASAGIAELANNGWRRPYRWGPSRSMPSAKSDALVDSRTFALVHWVTARK